MNNRIIILVVFAAMIGVFYSCKKDGEQLAPVTNNLITVVNASSDTLNIYENGTRINSGSNLVPFGQYQNLEITAGAQRYQFKKAGNVNTLIDLPLSLNDSSFYSLFVAGESADNVFLLQDVLFVDTAKGASNTFIRYVNASPDAGDIDFTISTYPIFKSCAFKSATSFVEVPAGAVFYSMTRQGESAPFASGNITLSAGVSYTLFSKGLIKGTGANALGARILPTVH
ncbi:DUF4397 domain-containing protein [Mucilaginibacter sp. dw_454]|uniref:DUF4397 domain-containing protein n=1 Tax=Mucilaginibacter sp. dw_454 TaxID=2720079 RepID=UPI001BD5D8E2|nr:DUF4397 domain-containing protein [Mucilaginibacter sp. dw_454]